MNKFLICVGLLYGAYWYTSTHVKFDETLVYIKKNPQASWAPGANYYVGVIYQERHQYGKAQEAFTQLVTNYSTSTYAAQGLRRLSAVAEENRDWPTAKQALERYIEEFPNNKEIDHVKERWELIKFK
jgi:TolA-binding protein